MTEPAGSEVVLDIEFHVMNRRSWILGVTVGALAQTIILATVVLLVRRTQQAPMQVAPTTTVDASETLGLRAQPVFGCAYKKPAKGLYGAEARTRGECWGTETICREQSDRQGDLGECIALEDAICSKFQTAFGLWAWFCYPDGASCEVPRETNLGMIPLGPCQLRSRTDFVLAPGYQNGHTLVTEPWELERFHDRYGP